MELSVNCLQDNFSNFWMKKYKERYDKMNDCDLKACESVEAIRDREFKYKVEEALSASMREIGVCADLFQQLVGDRQLKGVYITEDNDLYKKVKYESSGVAGWDQLVAVATTDDKNYVLAWFKVHNLYLSSISEILNHPFTDSDDSVRRVQLVTCTPSITVATNDVVLSWPAVHEDQDPVELTQKLLAEKLSGNPQVGKFDLLSNNILSCFGYALNGLPLKVTGYKFEGADDVMGHRYEVSIDGARLDPKDNLPDKPDYLHIRSVGRANMIGCISQAVVILGTMGVNVSYIAVQFTKMGSQIVMNVSKK